MQELRLKVDGMKCEGCVAAVRSALEDVEGVIEVEVTLAEGSATVHAEPSVDRDKLLVTITEAGYRAV